MRRRVMSHNVKRLPRRLRQAHLSQRAKSGLPPKTKRPSRKYRRRPSNLLAEYNRRQRNNKWLETHIWHAKRFHMTNKWRYRIASRPNDKCFKANYRAATDKCLLQDISYYICVEIKGQEDVLKTTLKTHCNPTALSFAAKRYISGAREGTVMFFRKNGYPRFPIGNVYFLWRSRETSSVRNIWIWVHPAFYDEFFSEIKSSFGFKANDAKENAADTTRHSITSYTSEADCQMTINEMNRFRLAGPSTLKVLTEVLRLPSLTESSLRSQASHERSIAPEVRKSSSGDEKSNADDISMKTDVSDSGEIGEASKDNTRVVKTLNLQKLRDKAWYLEYYKHEENLKEFTAQRQWWEDLSGSRSLAALFDRVVGLTVLDPRFFLPERRTKCQTETVVPGNCCPISVPADWNRSPIWDAEIRRVVSGSCVPTRVINDLRSQCLVPGVSNDKYFTEDVMAKIPILLIPKENFKVVGSSIDIVIPTSWALPFLLALVQRCVRVGALQETRTIAFESFDLNTPDVNDPDTSAYAMAALTTKQTLTEKYFRRPPNKRVNFVKFGIGSPFFCDWKNLTRDWSKTEDFYVLRNRDILLLLQTGISQTSSKKSRSAENSEHTKVNFQELNQYKNCLVRIRVSMMNRGSPKDFAIVCIPTSEDLEKLKNNKNWTGPVEKCHIDSNEGARVTSRTEHLLKLKRLRRKRIRQKKALEDKVSPQRYVGGSNNDYSANSASHHKMILEQWEKMSRLYLPENTRVRYSCGREVMGYLTMADYSLTCAKGMGLGYVTLASLIELINNKSNIVLVRNIQTRQYRLATLDVLEE